MHIERVAKKEMRSVCACVSACASERCVCVCVLVWLGESGECVHGRAKVG